MCVRTMQVTLGPQATPLVPSGDVIAKWVVFQNNSNHAMHMGDSKVSTSRGYSLAKSKSLGPFPAAPHSYINLRYWYVRGSAADVLDVIYEDGN